jgi:hypothetical protein
LIPRGDNPEPFFTKYIYINFLMFLADFINWKGEIIPIKNSEKHANIQENLVKQVAGFTTTGAIIANHH